MARIKMEGLGKVYDDGTRAVGNLDLEIAEGEFLSLLGPSGSGKTTILMLLAGFERPTRGSILLNGQRIDQLHLGFDRNGLRLVLQAIARSDLDQAHTLGEIHVSLPTPASASACRPDRG